MSRYRLHIPNYSDRELRIQEEETLIKWKLNYIAVRENTNTDNRFNDLVDMTDSNINKEQKIEVNITRNPR